MQKKKIMINEIIEGIDKVSNIVDENIFTEEENANLLTRRLEIDANSDNQLAKMIRPIVTLVTCLVWVFVHSMSVFKEVPAEVLYSCDAAFMTCIGFYFDSRRREKITQRKTIAAIRISKQQFREDKKEARRNRRK